jgi:hypothetical protein
VDAQPPGASALQWLLNIEPDGQLSEVEEAELYRHCGLD